MLPSLHAKAGALLPHLGKEREISIEQGDLSLLDDPVAQELLNSTNLVRVAYTWRDGTPRVIPIWFHWDGETIVLGTSPPAPKVDVLPNNSKVALTIYRDEWPYHALLIRGTAYVETVEGVTPEYAACAERYFGAEQGEGMGGRGAPDVLPDGPHQRSTGMGDHCGL
jgi:hypothetical protein